MTGAVARRLVSDVPLGAFLSARHRLDDRRRRDEPADERAGQDLHASASRATPAYDETGRRARVAERFKTDHTEFRVKPSAVGLIDTLIWHHDGPFGDSSAIPTYLVSQLTRQHVTVVLTGDGGDELFAGYLRFGAALAAERVPRARRRAACRRRAALLPRAANERHLLARARRFARFMHLPLRRAGRALEQPVSGRCRELLHRRRAAPDCSIRSRTCRGTIWKRSRGLAAQPAARRELRVVPSGRSAGEDRSLHDGEFARGALRRCSTRALTEYAASLPDDFKLDGRTTKAILRDAFADLLPADIDRRPKTGFGVPLDAWFRGELRDFVRDTLLGAVGGAAAVPARSTAVERSSTTISSGRANAGQRLWTLVCFERWLQLLPRWRAPTVAARDEQLAG